MCTTRISTWSGSSKQPQFHRVFSSRSCWCCRCFWAGFDTSCCHRGFRVYQRSWLGSRFGHRVGGSHRGRRRHRCRAWCKPGGWRGELTSMSHWPWFFSHFTKRHKWFSKKSFKKNKNNRYLTASFEPAQLWGCPVRRKKREWGDSNPGRGEQSQCDLVTWSFFSIFVESSALDRKSRDHRHLNASVVNTSSNLFSLQKCCEIQNFALPVMFLILIIKSFEIDKLVLTFIKTYWSNFEVQYNLVLQEVLWSTFLTLTRS